MTRTLLGVLILVLSAWAPAPASACSPGCSVTLAPEGTSSLPARLPVNGVFVAVPGGGSSVTTATLERTRAGVIETLTLVVAGPVLTIPDPQVDDQLVLTANLSCGSAPMREATFLRVMPAAPIPTSLGVLDVQPSRAAAVAVWDNRGGCASDLGSTVAPYTLALDASLEPWADALMLSPMLDDASWNDTADARVAPHFVFAHCAELLPSQTAYDTTPGEHRLRIDGTLRGLSAAISSNEVVFELTCAGASSGGCTVTPPTGSGSTRWVGLVAGALALALALAARRRT